MEYEFHEVANIFPMMSESEFSGLVNDIKENGQIEPIWLYRNKIIDGRNRYKACQEIGIEPKTEVFDGHCDLVSFVVSKNLHRRQLTPSQLAMVGARIKHIFEDGAKERQLAHLKVGKESPLTSKEANGKQSLKNDMPYENGKTSQKAASIVNSSHASVERATKVLKDGIQDLVQAVDTGDIVVTKAFTIAKLPKEEQSTALQEALEKPVKTIAKVIPIKSEVKVTKSDNPTINEMNDLLSDAISYMEEFEHNFSNLIFDIDVNNSGIDFYTPIRAYRNVIVTIEGLIKMQKTGRVKKDNGNA